MTTGRLRLRDIREHEGSQARAWEELAFQLRPDVGPGWSETRKTRAPDGGVEWYEVYDDGHQEGFQAKFNENLNSALGGMAESVKAVASKRPQMSRLVFVVPYDFTDAAKARSKSDQERWSDAVARWRAEIPGADRLKFDVIRAGDIVAELTRSRHAGRRAYWFGEVELTEDWLRRRWAEALNVAGERYTPAADTESRVNDALDALGATPAFFARISSLTHRVLKACQRDRGIWGKEVGVAASWLGQIEGVVEASIGGLGGDDVNRSPVDFWALNEAASALVNLIVTRQGATSTPRGDRALNDALSAASELRNFTRSPYARVYGDRSIAVEGVAGQGKTHALMKMAESLLDDGTPALILLGQQLKEGNWWPAACAALGGPPAGSADEFLDALDSLAEAKRSRAVIIVDALNEAQDPQMWRSELPSLLTQIASRKHLALVVSYRTDYRETISPPKAMARIRHPGLAGREQEALNAYCALFGIPVPPTAILDSAFSSPLFLRLYCAVVAADTLPGTQPPTRSTLFAQYADLQAERIREALGLPPTSGIVNDALAIAADLLLANDGQAVPRARMESSIDRLLPDRVWPNTLFQRLVSEGLLEVRPGYDAIESVAFPFQAYSEQLLASRLLELHGGPKRFAVRRWLGFGTPSVSRALSKRLQQESWLWRSMAVLLPEVHGVELIDILPSASTDDRMLSAMRESLTDRSQLAFNGRALDLLGGELQLKASDWVDVVLTLAPREAHPANADWLHARLLAISMPDRDASWSIDTYDADETSPAFDRLSGWADRAITAASTEQARLGCLSLMWLLTSPNRFLRDRASRAVVSVLSRHIDQAPRLIETARLVDDVYVQERVLTCVYGAMVVAGPSETDAVQRVIAAVRLWITSGLPVHAVARDSARGIVYWANSCGLSLAGLLEQSSPPYGSNPPNEPPSATELKASHGYVKNEAGEYVEWRASAILMSCLDWMGDFNKYVVQSDVGFFSRYPLSGPPPAKGDRGPTAKVEADWAGRWIADRAIKLGWTAERFEAFETGNQRRDGREGHKAERFGKKYQWIAHQELLARLADNFHPAWEPWDPRLNTYEGPWVWYGRDFDPTLPPARRINGRGVCFVESDTERWAALSAPDMTPPSDPNAWVGRSDDLPAADQMFVAVDIEDREWIVLSRYSTWDRANAERRGMTNRELDVFFLQFSWLTAAGDGHRLHDLIIERGLGGRWMPEMSRPYTQYLGEQSWSPIVQQRLREPDDDRPQLIEAGVLARPAVEKYLWEGNVLDCSIDESVDLRAPSPELLGSAEWVGFRAEWKSGTRTVAKSIRIDDGENGQEALIADRGWLESRLAELGADLVIATLSEKHALLDEEVDYRSMAFSDICYSALISPGEADLVTGPLVKVRGQEPRDDEVTAQEDAHESDADEPV